MAGAAGADARWHPVLAARLCGKRARCAQWEAAGSHSIHAHWLSLQAAPPPQPSHFAPAFRDCTLQMMSGQVRSRQVPLGWGHSLSRKYWAVTPGGAFSTIVAAVWEVGSAAGMLGVLHTLGGQRMCVVVCAAEVEQVSWQAVAGRVASRMQSSPSAHNPDALLTLRRGWSWAECWRQPQPGRQPARPPRSRCLQRAESMGMGVGSSWLGVGRRHSVGMDSGAQGCAGRAPAAHPAFFLYQLQDLPRTTLFAD